MPYDEWAAPDAEAAARQAPLPIGTSPPATTGPTCLTVATRDFKLRVRLLRQQSRAGRLGLREPGLRLWARGVPTVASDGNYGSTWSRPVAYGYKMSDSRNLRLRTPDAAVVTTAAGGKAGSARVQPAAAGFRISHSRIQPVTLNSGCRRCNNSGGWEGWFCANLAP